MGLEARRLTIHFGVKDKDISPWIKGAKKGVFSFIVKAMIRSYIADKSSCKVTSLLNNPVENPGSFNKNLSMGMEDEDVFQFILAQEENCRADKIKEVIRFYIKQHNGYTSEPIVGQEISHRKRRQQLSEQKQKITVENKLVAVSIEDEKIKRSVKTIDDLQNEKVSDEEQERLMALLMGGQ